MILGVSGWLGEKIGLTTEQVRIAFLLSVLLLGAGVGLYLILWLVKIISKE
jgi:phage shock protein PspC (stress-responsive transcriptional regulator)